jgi:transcriptional regulator with XRE-family HTH domain
MLYGILFQKSRKFLMAARSKARADLKGIGERIRELRGEILQEELAEHLGISQGQLSKIECGKMGPTIETLVRLSDRFGKTLDWIVKG